MGLCLGNSHLTWTCQFQTSSLFFLYNPWRWMEVNNHGHAREAHNDPVIWTGLLHNKRVKPSTGTATLPVAASLRLTGFCCHGGSLGVWWRRFYGALGPGVVRVIYSAAALPCQQSGIHYYVCYLPAAWGQCLHPAWPSPAQPAGVGEHILVCQLFQWDKTFSLEEIQ